MIRKADLHAHTTRSDGVSTPREVALLAIEAGLDAVAITDHDAVGGVAPAMKAAAGKPIEVVAGVELSSYAFDRGVHVIGLYIDHENGRLLESVDLFRRKRLERARKMIEKLRELGVGISNSDIPASVWRKAVGRPHVADALLKVGAVKNFNQAFVKYIGHNGPAYVPKHKISPAEAAEIIHAAGGVAILAHPFASLRNKREISDVMAMGLDGIETCHPLHEDSQDGSLRVMARERGWLISGGGDSHGPGRDTAAVGQYWIDGKYLDEIRKRAELYRSKNV